MSKQLALLFIWILTAAIWFLLYVYLFIDLLAHAVTFQWDTQQQILAPLLTITTVGIVWFLTKKIHNILLELAQSGKSIYTVYMLDKHNDKQQEEISTGEFFVEVVAWTVFIILGFWGVVHILLSLMDRL